MTIVAMSIDQRRAKRKTSTLPGVPLPDGPPLKTRLASEGGTPAAEMTGDSEATDHGKDD